MMVTGARELMTTVMLSRSEDTNTNHAAHAHRLTKGAESNQREYLKVKVYTFAALIKNKNIL